MRLMDNLYVNIQPVNIGRDPDGAQAKRHQHRYSMSAVPMYRTG